MENLNFLSDNNLSEYGIIICCGLILGCSVFYLFRSNNIANLPNNKEALTYQEIEAIKNENMVPIGHIEDILTDSEIDSEIDYANMSDHDSTVSFDDIDLTDLYHVPLTKSTYRNDEFIMPDVDFNVCPIEELKLFEFCSLYGKEMAEHSISEAEMMELISLFPEKELATN